MSTLFFVGFVMVFLAVTVGVRLYNTKKWERAAEQLGLSFDKGGLFGRSGLSGKYKQVPVKVYTVRRGGKNNRRTYTIYQASPTVALPAGLRLSSEGLLASVGKFFGAQDVEVGLPLLDDAFIIKASAPQAARQFLGRPGVEEALLELRNVHKNMKLENGNLRIETRGFDSAYEMERVLDCLAETCRSLASADQQPEQSEPAQLEIDEQPAEGGEPDSFGRPTRSAQRAERADAPAASGDRADGDWW
jgi:hypothetical protein